MTLCVRRNALGCSLSQRPPGGVYARHLQQVGGASTTPFLINNLQGNLFTCSIVTAPQSAAVLVESSRIADTAGLIYVHADDTLSMLSPAAEKG